MPNPSNRARALVDSAAVTIARLIDAAVKDPRARWHGAGGEDQTMAEVVEVLQALALQTDHFGPDPAPMVQTDWGERGYVQWRWNSPEHAPGKPPMMLLVVDALQYGRVVDFRMSPKQAQDLCAYGIEAIAQQALQFGDEQPRDFDTRKEH